MKQCIYYMHIPRTSGTFIVNNLREQKKEYNIVAGHKFPILLEDLKRADYISGHYANTPIEYADKTFTILRDPIERTFSYIKIMSEVFYPHMPLDHAFSLFLNNKIIRKNTSNQHSKFFSGVLNLEMYNKYVSNQRDMVFRGWDVVDYKTTSKDVIEHLEKNKIEVLKFEDPKLYNKVFSLLDMEIPKDVKTRINKSKDTDEKLYNKYYNEIKKINQIDIEIYEHFRNSK